ncbi:hypothetical protein [Bacillus xiapuensis]|uniref:hypothetical protein n=1 Tax=Bacillus xiapuensis TaxID=2014075 RepID=UPI000C235972|nr:hypothetical protein [Bacillus xiapuensis]
MKKVLSIILFFVLLFSLIPSNLLKVSAEENTDLSNYKIVDGSKLVNKVNLDTQYLEHNVKKALNEYGLKPIDLNSEVAKGTEVIFFDTVDEFHKFMSIIDQPIEIESNLQEDFVNTKANSNQVFFSAAATTKTFKTSKNSGFGNINLHTKVRKGAKNKLTVEKTWTSHTGVTLGIDWKDNYKPYSRLNKSRTSGTSYAEGTKSWVIFVKGIGTIRKQNVKLTLKFNNKF